MMTIRLPKENRCPTSLVRTLGTLMFCLGLFCATPPKVRGSEGWKSISLRHRPLYIVNNAASLWVCGTGEMIAVSSDAGKTWLIKHENQDGEVLLKIFFVDESVGFAAGSHGMILRTEDGGESWKKSGSVTETIWDLAFANERDGLINTDSGVQITHDGGFSWRTIITEEIQEISKPKIAGLAILDTNRAAMLYRGESGEPLVVSTEDGGATWKSEFFHSCGLWALVKHGGEFWMFGYEVIEKDKPGGGYGVALALHSKDAKVWKHGVRAPNEFSKCTTQGCILWDGAIVGLYGEKPTFSAVPANGNLTSIWASTGNTLCSIRSLLQCTTATEVQAPPPRPQSNRPSSGGIDPYLAPPSTLDPACLRCWVAAFPLDKKYLGGVPATVNLPGGGQRRVTMPGLQSVLTLEYTIQKDGTIGEARVKNAPNREIESALKDSMKAWVMIPPREGGIAREEKHKASLMVSCMAFPSNDEGLCTPLMK